MDECYHEWPLYPIGLTGINSTRFRCKKCGEIGSPGDKPPDPDMGKPPQSICNFCGGILKVRQEDRNHEGDPKYVCTVCGNIPFTPDPPPVQSRVAVSYNVTPRVGKKREV